MRLLTTLCVVLCFSVFPARAFAADSAEDPPQVLDERLGPIGADRLFKDAKLAVQVVNVSTGEEVWSRNADLALNPASTTKIITTATALRTLGPAHTFRTVVYSDDRPNAKGEVKQLFIHGGGDPTMVVEKLWKIARNLELAGITRVKKGLVLDESYFGSDHKLPGWDKQRDLDRGPAYFPSLSALSLNFNTVAIAVRPGVLGKAAIVVLETDAGSYIELVSKVKTGAAGSRRRIHITRSVGDEKMVFTVEGSVPSNASVRKFYRSVDDPTLYFGHAFRALLQERGIQVDGTIELGHVPKSAEYLTESRSAPLTSILMDMNKFSSNFMAEQVLRTVGAEQQGEGTTTAGLVEVRAYLASIGVKDGYALFNGSGLARKGALPPSALCAVLMDMVNDPRVGSEFRSSLAIAGVDGTLRRRLRNRPGRLRGKTGTLDGVHGLVGYIEAADGALYAFAFLANEFRGGSATVKRLHDDFAQRMFELSGDGKVDPPSK